MSGVIVHEWIESTGGAEKVVEAFSSLAPDAPLLCLWDDAPGRFGDIEVRESVLAKTPLRRNKALALPAMPWVWRSWPWTPCDWALVSSHLFAHHLRFRGRHQPDRYVYVHTPARYLWEPRLDERGSSLPVRSVAPALRGVDRRRALEGGSFAGNSDFVVERINRCWDVDARTIYPPVDVVEIQAVSDWRDCLGTDEAEVLSGLPEDFILGASRLVSYKRLEDAIHAGELVESPVVIAGDGPDLGRLRAIADIATVPVHFLGRVSTQMLYALYQRCIVYVFTGVEDFGIMPVEAMAAGARVVGNRLGGVAETVREGKTGALCDPDDRTDLSCAVERAASCSSAESIRNARRFDLARFQDEVAEWVGVHRLPGYSHRVRRE